MAIFCILLYIFPNFLISLCILVLKMTNLIRLTIVPRKYLKFDRKSDVRIILLTFKASIMCTFLANTI